MKTSRAHQLIQGISRLFRQHAIWLALAIVVACRFAEVNVFDAQLSAAIATYEVINLVNNPAIACFVFVPTFGFLVARNVSFLRLECVVTRSMSRSAYVVRCFFMLLGEAALFAAFVSFSLIPLCMFHSGSSQLLAITVFESFFLQILFFATTALVYFCTETIIQTTPLSYAMLIVYGLWDFVAGTTVGGGLPYIGWSMTLVNEPFDLSSLVIQALVLGSQSFILLLVANMACRFVDMIPKGGTR